jgi:5'-phosphate synthase pdxT subunit
VRTLPVFATCAGAILLGEGGEHLPAPPLGVLDATVARNAYGRQVDSFLGEVACDVLGGPLPAVFIRAPRIRQVGPGVEVLAAHGGEPVLVRQGNVVAATFHPELTGDRRLHRLLFGQAQPARRSA